MRFRIGGIPLDANSTDFVRRAEPLTNARGIPVALRWRWRVTVYLKSLQAYPADIQNDFARQEATIFALTSVRDQEYAIHADDGSPVAVLSPIGSLSGTVARSLGNPEQGNGQYAGQRTVTFEVDASYPVAGAAGALMSFEESLTFQGDGAPPWEETVGLSGVVVRQYLRPSSPCFAFQTGSAVGFLAYPAFGGPHGAPVSFWPASYKSDLSRYTLGAPTGEGNTLINFPVSWSYTHSRYGTPYLGRPHLWK